jgi:hypothetical protein
MTASISEYPLPLRGQERDDLETGHLARAERWKPFASFVVEFQTRPPVGQIQTQQTKVHHIETDTWKAWPDIEGKELCQWMVEQLDIETGLGSQVPIPETFPVERAPTEANAGMTLAITQIQVFQPPNAATPLGVSQAGQPFPHFVQGEAPFAPGITFELGGAALADLSGEPVTIHVQTLVYNLSTGTVTHLEDLTSASLPEDQAPYTILLPALILSSGVYRLQFWITLQATPPVTGHATFPLFQVAS